MCPLLQVISGVLFALVKRLRLKSMEAGDENAWINDLNLDIVLKLIHEFMTEYPQVWLYAVDALMEPFHQGVHAQVFPVFFVQL
jgi:hypothetical protein